MELQGRVSLFRFGIPVILIIYIFYNITDIILKLRQICPWFHSSVGWIAWLLHNLLGEVVPAPVLLVSPMNLPPITGKVSPCSLGQLLSSSSSSHPKD